MFSGTTFADLDHAVQRTLASREVEAACPVEDCPNEGKRTKLYSCKHCEFTGCVDCLDQHEQEGHSTNGQTRSELEAGLRGSL